MYKTNQTEDTDCVYFSRLDPFTNLFTMKSISLLPINEREIPIIADIGCGNGSFALEIYERYQGKCIVEALDLSPLAVHSLQMKLNTRQISGIEVRIMNAEKLLFNDNVFNHVGLIFSLMYMDVQRALKYDIYFNSILDAAINLKSESPTGFLKNMALWSYVYGKKRIVLLT